MPNDTIRIASGQVSAIVGDSLKVTPDELGYTEDHQFSVGEVIQVSDYYNGQEFDSSYRIASITVDTANPGKFELRAYYFS